jgi:hypothetical protein
MRQEKGKVFFFEKKKQETFVDSGFGPSGEAQPSSQKFFGSFFQKRTAFLLGVEAIVPP